MSSPNSGQPIAAPSPPELINYQTGKKSAKAAGIRTFSGDPSEKIAFQGELLSECKLQV